MDVLSLLLQPLNIPPSSFADGGFCFDITGAYEGRLWLETNGDKMLLNNGQAFTVCHGDIVRVPENIGCRQEALRG